jgi:hypothetical protein
MAPGEEHREEWFGLNEITSADPDGAGDRAFGLYPLQPPPRRAFLETQAIGSTHLPLPDVRNDNAPKVRFSATRGQEPEVEVALV